MNTEIYNEEEQRMLRRELRSNLPERTQFPNVVASNDEPSGMRTWVLYSTPIVRQLGDRISISHGRYYTRYTYSTINKILGSLGYTGTAHRSKGNCVLKYDGREYTLGSEGDAGWRIVSPIEEVYDEAVF